MGLGTFQKFCCKGKGEKTVSKIICFAYDINECYYCKIVFLIKIHSFPFELLTYGLRIVNLWFSCRKPMFFDA